MSVWPSVVSPAPSLCTSEGALVSVSLTVAPRDLEKLLDALAELDFPINPQIYHDACLVYRHADGREELEPVTLVEFPAYEGHLPRVRQILNLRNFPAGSLHIAEMLEEIHSEERPEPAPAGAPYQCLIRRKQARPVARGAH